MSGMGSLKPFKQSQCYLTDVCQSAVPDRLPTTELWFKFYAGMSEVNFYVESAVFALSDIPGSQI